MGIADWIILAFLVFSVVTAAMQGFFHEAFGVAGLVVGYMLAAWRYRWLADWFEPHLKQRWLGEIGSFLLIFVVVLIVAGVAGRLTRWLAKEAGLTTMDRVLGGVLGLVRGALIVAIVLVGMAAFTPTSRWLAGSQWAPYFLVAGRAAVWLAPAELRQRFDQGLDYLRKARAPAVPQPAGPSK